MTDSHPDVTLDDKYAFDRDRVYMTGTQALVRLLLAQHRQDRAASLHTGGFVSGYRGSPLGSLDRELWRASQQLNAADIHFWPGLNEDLAATAIWGSQQIEVHHRPKFHGVFGLWYGKGAGLDRSTDAIRHAHAAGTTRHGGVLAVVGDDHALKSSSNPYNCEPTFADLVMPVLYPASIAEMIDYGLLGWAMSRASGCWVGLKTLAEILDSSGSTSVRTQPLPIVPALEQPPFGAVHARWPDPWPAAEQRLIDHKIPAALAFARANRIDRVVVAADTPRLGIVVTGKSHTDLMQALSDLGLTPQDAGVLGISIYKVGMPWPLEPEGMKAFAATVPEILVIEEKRGVIEGQLKEILYGLPADRRPAISGKRSTDGRWQFPWIGELTPEAITRVLAERIGTERLNERAKGRLAVLHAHQTGLTTPASTMRRSPLFCSGCPHNTSTRVPEGSRALGGVGCHGMVTMMDRDTATFTQMGGEGVPWIGQSPFTDTAHMFVNLGDGTYFHSGSLAIRASVAAGVNITFKLLFNDAVAMTGGQPVDGQLDVPRLTAQLAAEGVKRIVVVSDEPDKYDGTIPLAPGVTVRHRKELTAVQQELRACAGVTALVYDQTCAAEKRRRRKTNTFPDPARRVFINELVCEGCGDCSQASNCLSVVPLDTDFGRKRQIDQSSCNKDFSCLDGFCPSFVTVEGGRLRKPARLAPPAGELPEPAPHSLDEPFDIFITGVGGTGVVTIGALLGMAAHIEGRGASVMDVLGMAQKGGAVVSHVRIVGNADQLHAARVPDGGADLLLACDALVAGQVEYLRKIGKGKTHAIVNTQETITGDFLRNPDAALPLDSIAGRIRDIVGSTAFDALDATALAKGLAGDSIATNLFMLGYAFQRGRVPLSRGAIEQAIRLNGGPVEINLSIFAWGRSTAHASHATPMTMTGEESAAPADTSLDAFIARRADFLVAYQDARYAAAYRKVVDHVREREHAIAGNEALAMAVADALFKLMAYKDEYEVARLYTETGFLDRLSASYEGKHSFKIHLAPPVLGGHDPHSGRPPKRAFGPWILPVLRILAKFRFLRGGPLDPFGYFAERQMERRRVSEFQTLFLKLAAELTPDNHALAVEIATTAARIRGYGHVKERNARDAQSKIDTALKTWPTAPARPANITKKAMMPEGQC